MRKGVLILLLGVLAGLCGFGVLFYIRTIPQRRMMQEPQPELAWLKTEFGLSDSQFARVVQLHEAYLPDCAERCKRIEEQNGKLRSLLVGSSALTEEIRAVLAERARLRADCEAEMLRHFVEISRSMPTRQGQRYLAWVQQQTFLQGVGMEQRHQVGHNQTGARGTH